MAMIGYIRVSTEQQDLQKQKHLLLEYAQHKQVLIKEFVEVEVSSRKSAAARRLDELTEKLQTGDTLLVAELSRLGRNMVETLQLIEDLSQRGIELVFVRQPELSTTGAHGKLLLAIYSYFAEAEREFISMRTKQGLAAIKASGKSLGRPKGARNKKRQELETLLPTIKNYRAMGFSVPTIHKLLNAGREKPLSFSALRYFIREELGNKSSNEY